MNTPSKPSASIWTRKLPGCIPFSMCMFFLLVALFIHLSATRPDNPIVKFIGRLILGN